MILDKKNITKNYSHHNCFPNGLNSDCLRTFRSPNLLRAATKTKTKTLQTLYFLTGRTAYNIRWKYRYYCYLLFVTPQHSRSIRYNLLRFFLIREITNRAWTESCLR